MTYCLTSNYMRHKPSYPWVLTRFNPAKRSTHSPASPSYAMRYPHTCPSNDG